MTEPADISSDSVAVVATSTGPPPTSPGRGARAGWAAGATAAVWALYWIGSSRAFNYDAGLSVRDFIATPSLFDSFSKHVVFNNHPLLSFVDHLVFSATGSSSETTMRLLPVTFAAVTVGLLVWVISERLGLVAAVVAAVVLALNPVFFENGREVRGYSLLTLSAVATTALLLAEPGRWRRAAYAVAGAAGVATHAYMAPVLVCHVLIAWRRGEDLKKWAPVWIGLGLLGVVVHVPQLSSVGARGHLFRPGFPEELAFQLLGGNAVAVALMTPVVAVALWAWRRNRAVLAGGAGVVAVVIGLWWWAPRDLYVRMFIWMAPLVAVAAASVIARWRIAAPLVLGAAIAGFVPNVAALRQPEIANRATAQYIADVVTPGEQVCGLGQSVQGMGPYRLRFVDVTRRSQFARCDLAFVLLPSLSPRLLEAARSNFRYACELPALTPGVVVSRRSLPVAARSAHQRSLPRCEP